jgi:hypothetical protein
MSEAKPFVISKWEVWDACQRVKANKGAAGVDDQKITAFEGKVQGQPLPDLESDVVGQLPSPPVLTVKIPKANGGERKLGHTDGVRSDCATGGEIETGAGGGPAVPSGFLRVSTGAGMLVG